MWPAAYFLSFQILAGLMLLNLFVAAILMSVQEAGTELSVCWRRVLPPTVGVVTIRE